MTANKKPEIELEVSCGGTFKISTEAMACKITVLESATGQASQPLQPAEEIAPPPPQPAAVEPEVREVQVEDPFFKKSVGSFCDDMQGIINDMAASVGKSTTAAGSSGAIAARTVPAEAEAVVRQRLAEQGGALAKAQAKIVDQRFTLTFLKNHPIFSRRDPDAAEITVSSMELDKLHGKIKSAMQTAALINDTLAEVKEKLGVDATENELTASIAAMAASQKQMIDAFCRLMFVREEKEANPAAAYEAAEQAAAAKIASLQEREMPAEEAQDEELDLSDQGAIDRLLDAAVPDNSSSGVEEEEMSDEEALRKLQEFGL